MEGRVKGQRSRKSLICQNTMEGEQNPRHYWRVDLHYIHVLQLCCSGMGLLLSKSLMKKRTCNYNIMYFRLLTPPPPCPSPPLPMNQHPCHQTFWKWDMLKLLILFLFLCQSLQPHSQLLISFSYTWVTILAGTVVLMLNIIQLSYRYPFFKKVVQLTISDVL